MTIARSRGIFLAHGRIAMCPAWGNVPFAQCDITISRVGARRALPQNTWAPRRPPQAGQGVVFIV